MSDENKSITPRLSDREQVERTADRLRDELMLTIEELDRRRELALDLKYQGRRLLARNRELLLTVGGVALGLVGVGLGVSWWNARRHREVVWERRSKAIKRAWNNPDRVASASKERPMALELGRKLFFIFATALATALARNSVQTLVPPKAPARPEKKKRADLQLLKTPAHA